LTNEVLGFIAPLLTVVVTIGGTWWKETQQGRSHEQVRQRLLIQVKDEISVIEAWAKAHGSLDAVGEPPAFVRERARQDLDVAYERMGQISPELRQPVTLQATLARLLVRHVPIRGGARVSRVVYYISLLMMVLWGSVGFFQPNSWASGTDIIATLLTYFTVAVVPAWLLRWLTMSLAQRQERRRQHAT
jgi:hypothetical protein